MSTSRIAVIPALNRPTAYFALTKPDVTFLVVLTTLAGYFMGERGPVNVVGLFHAVFATTLLAGGTAALNHFLERSTDAKMRRTAGRPLPLGVIEPAHALVFGAVLVAAGALYLALAAKFLACALGLATTGAYLGLYTPLKKRTTLATIVGAFPGAAPPLIGWAAAAGNLSVGAWILFGILFLWQFPHFLAIAWMYREDYARGGIQMLPVVDRTGTATFRQVLTAAAALVPMSLLGAVVGMAGVRYFFGALVLGMALLQMALWSARTKTNASARWLMHATVIHVPLLFALMMLDKLPR